MSRVPQVQDEVEQEARQMVLKGQAATIGDAYSALFKRDPGLYERYRREVGTVDGPSQARAPRLPPRVEAQARALAKMLAPRDEAEGLEKVAVCLEGLIDTIQKRRHHAA